MNKNVVLIILASALLALVLQTRAVWAADEDNAYRNGDSAIGPPIGSSVRLQFRRDALGGAANLPVPPTTMSINGAEVSIMGKLTAATELWLCVKVKERPHWVPREVVLLVEQLDSN